MKQPSKTDPTYVLGRSPVETERLQKQGNLYNPSTRSLLQRAGIVRGMKVLDIGSGAGDVALLAGELVGPSGTVVGVDLDVRVLETARARVRAAGLTNVSFVAGDIRSVALQGNFDAVIGRHILLYTAHPAAALSAAIQYLRPAGIVAFHEFDFSVLEQFAEAEGVPASYQQCVRWIVAGFRRAGAHLQMGIELPRAFVEAGLPVPHMHLDGIIGTGPDWAGYDFLARTLRNLWPRLLTYGIVQAQEVEVDTLIEDLRAHVIEQRTSICVAFQVGAWTRTG